MIHRHERQTNAGNPAIRSLAEAIDLEVSAPVITLSLMERLRSRDKDSFTDKLLAAMRNQFGGHAVMSAVTTAPASGSKDA